MEVLGEMLRAPNVPQGHRKRKANHKTRFPFTCLDRFMLALLARRFPGFSRFQRSQDESVLGFVLGDVLEASWSDLVKFLRG